MSKRLTEIAQELKDANKKVQLIYAFNGTGKTRLSREFKQLIAPKNEAGDDETELSRDKILYYNAFTEDLFYWDNDLDLDAEPKLKIQPNSFTDWILRDRGQDRNIIDNFQRFSNDKLTPTFIEKDKPTQKDGRRFVTKTYPEVRFSFDRGSERTGSVKISKGEESNFIWSIFYTLLQEVISILDESAPDKRDDDQFNSLEYVFIDDPVSSLDDSHLIELAVTLAALVKSSESTLNFIITTHNPLFYNVLQNELNNTLYKKQPDGTRKAIYKPKQARNCRLAKKADGSFQMDELSSGSPFSYHLFLWSEIQEAIRTNQVKKFHFNFLRNILEKMATFLGYNNWRKLLPEENGHPDPFANRILNLSSHSAHAGEEIAEIEDRDKEKLRELVDHLNATYGLRKQVE